MRAKGAYTTRGLVLLVAIALAYLFNKPLLPIGNDIKISWGYPRESLLNFTELTAQYGYVTEEHPVTTQDGYILKLFRIPRGDHCKDDKKTPVIVMHGLLQSSDAWLDAGPGNGLAYLLADACYDTWVGNQRGNYYSRAHTHLNPDADAQYWQFSIDEIGLYDVPATIDYVLNSTGEKKVSYIGYSQGSSVFFVMCSERPEYRDKVQVFVGLAPASRHTHSKSTAYRTLLTAINKLNPLLSTLGMHEIFPKGALSQELLAFFCQTPYMSRNLCYKFESVLDSRNPGSITNDTTRMLFGRFPAGTSVKNMLWYGQSNGIDSFVKFDYGTEKNLELYGSPKPPEYNLSAVSVPVVVLYGRSDQLVDSQDVQWLVQRLPNVIETFEVKNTFWNHFDSSYSQYFKELVFPKIHQYLLKYTRR